MRFLALLFTLITFTPYSYAIDIEPSGKAVLVTGASSGLGRKIAETLAVHGVYVYAGARKQADIESLSRIENMMGIRLDVTDSEDIQNAVEFIEKQGRGLYGLVNNAGVFLHAPLIEVTEKDLDFLMNVNVYGPYRITKAFAPLIIQSKGRVSNIGSIAGIASGPLFGPYSMTKHAIEAYTDSLSAEMKKFDVQVSIIEPGNFKSNIMKNMQKRMAKLDSGDKDTLYQAEYQSLINFTQADRSSQKEPDAVANAVVQALFSAEPKIRYLVAPNQQEADLTIGAALRKATQVNHGHEFSKDRTALISILDDLME